MTGIIRRYPLTAFIVLAWGWTWVMVGPVVAASRGLLELRMGALFWEVLGAFGPFFAALIVLYATRGIEGLQWLGRSLLHWRVGRGWLAFTLLSPFAILLLALAWQRLATGAWPDLSVLPAGTLGTFGGLMNVLLIKSLWQGLAEEPGWRGYMLPKLRERHGPLAATFILWPFWLLWHLPFFLARPEFALVQFLGFSLGILSAAVWLTVIWEGTRSVLMAVVWHALINLTRFVALAVSPGMFLTFSLLVTVLAVPLSIWWSIRVASQGRNHFSSQPRQQRV